MKSKCQVVNGVKCSVVHISFSATNKATKISKLLTGVRLHGDVAVESRKNAAEKSVRDVKSENIGGKK
jgi:hypothetical protein